ncbi:MAG: hypothetical protein JWN36_3073 [Microbacteriaceae bacterium]|nr:hypothetical protein [Microbacteriaceae bacterium]
MANPDLLVDIRTLQNAETNLAAILDEFKNANEFSDNVADACGNDHLGDKVHDFAHNWNIHRGRMLDAISALHDSVKKIYDSFDETDRKLAAAIASKDTTPVGTP